MRIENDVLSVLSTAIVNGRSLVLTGQLDRNLYMKTNKVIEAAGGKWSRKDKAHIFDYEAETRVDEIILSGEVDIPKDEFNYFPTPKAVVEIMIEKSNIQPGMSVLEPSAGKGAIAYSCADIGAKVDCYELMEANFASLAGDAKLGEVKRGDFLEQNPSVFYDRVMMNPPFIKQNDIKHVLHALKFLKEDGLLVSVMSAGVMFRDNKLTKDFRQFVSARNGSIEALPDLAFKESGTNVRTVIVTIPA